jgi:hypothetical protein
MAVEHELTEEEEFALIEKDPIAALCYFLKRAGATMTLYGVPVSEEELRSQASASSDERIERVICSSIKDKMTDAEKLKLLLDKCEEIVPYVLATLPYESQAVTKHNVTCDTHGYVAIHGGRAVSSTRQLTHLLKLVEELKGK